MSSSGKDITENGTPPPSSLAGGTVCIVHMNNYYNNI